MIGLPCLLYPDPSIPASTWVLPAAGFGSLSPFTNALTQQGDDAVYASGGHTIPFVGPSVAEVVATLQLSSSAEAIDDDAPPMPLAEPAEGSFFLAGSVQSGDDPFDFAQIAAVREVAARPAAVEVSEIRLASLELAVHVSTFDFSAARIATEDSSAFAVSHRAVPARAVRALDDAPSLLHADFDSAALHPQQFETDWA